MLKHLFVVCTLIIAVSVACSGPSPTPTSPSAALPAGAGAESDAVTLKASAPTPTSPVGGAKTDTVRPTLSVTNGVATYVTVALVHRFQVFDAAGALVVDSGPVSSGASTTAYTLTTDLGGDKTYTWRARAEYQGNAGPWSSTASFITPDLKGYIAAQEIYDPLTTNETVGTSYGAVTFLPGQGIRLDTQFSRVSYTLPEPLTTGEFSMMITGVDEGTAGDKSKVMSMQEGAGDITSNDYRFTAEHRGRDYPDPGAIQFRIITGDAGDHGRIHDSSRIAVFTSDERWYFWKLTWRDGAAELEVREDNENGRILYRRGVITDGHPYRPVPHIVHLGAPVGRAGPQDATKPGMIIKNVWVSARPRPSFPGIR